MGLYRSCVAILCVTHVGSAAAVRQEELATARQKAVQEAVGPCIRVQGTSVLKPRKSRNNME